MQSLKVGFLAALIATFSMSSALAAEHEVRMLNKGVDGKMVFEPSVLHVEVGDTVTFIPTDPNHDSISVVTPEGANTWHGRRNQTVSVEINKEGVYIYKCAPHFYYGMVGVIQAGAATNLDAARTVAEEMSSKFIIHEDRLIGYLEKVR
ncbi:MAG: pseudoazurin [Pseudomonadota bacterium]